MVRNCNALRNACAFSALTATIVADPAHCVSNKRMYTLINDVYVIRDALISVYVRVYIVYVYPAVVIQCAPFRCAHSHTRPLNRHIHYQTRRTPADADCVAER